MILAFVAPQKPRINVKWYDELALYVFMLVTASLFRGQNFISFVTSSSIPEQIIVINRTGSTQTYTVPWSGTWDFALIGCGGGGGAATGYWGDSTKQPFASGGSAGGTAIANNVQMNAGAVINLALQVGGAGGQTTITTSGREDAGSNCSNSTASIPGVSKTYSMTANGGKGGYAWLWTGATGEYVTGGTATGGDTNRTGGRGGSVSGSDGYDGTTTNGGQGGAGSGAMGTNYGAAGGGGGAAGVSVSAGDAFNYVAGSGGYGGSNSNTQDGFVPGGGGGAAASTDLFSAIAWAGSGGNARFIAHYRGG